MQKTSTKQKIALGLFGLFLCIILCESGLWIGGFSLRSLQKNKNIKSMQQDGAFRILCLGESTTAPWGSHSYPTQLERILNQNNTEEKFSVINEGVMGIKTDVILEQLEDNLRTYDPNIVIAMMGINDTEETKAYGDVSPDISEKRTLSWLKSSKTIKLIKLLAAHMAQKDDQAYVKLGMFYRDAQEPEKSEAMFKKALTINPQNDEAYIELGINYGIDGMFDKSDEMIQKAMDINPENSEVYIELGQYYYRYHRNFDKAKEMFNKALKLNPKSDQARIALGILYISQGKLAKAEEILPRTHQDIQEETRLSGIWAVLHELKGNQKTAEDYFEKLTRLQDDYYFPATRQNYRHLNEILARKGIKLISMQYPMRTIEPLKRVFQDRENIIFVDNEQIFKEALSQEGYNTYFTDMFAGNFGHGTAKGNRLLAENVAQIILKEFFD